MNSEIGQNIKMYPLNQGRNLFMKKMALALAAALMTLGMSTAFAATPSKTTTDVTQVKEVATVNDCGDNRIGCK